MTQTWKSSAELAASPLARRDEFGPDVAAAIADLRSTHGLDSPSCQHAGNASTETQRLDADLRTLLPGMNRRGFLQMTGAAAVFALVGCQEKHPDTIVPFDEQPEGTTLGNALWYASTLRESGFPVPVLVKTYDGRPIKIEGNGDCALTRGKADAFTQAALVNLYDPDRLQDGPKAKDGAAFATLTWDALDAQVGAALKDGPVALLTGPIDGPARRTLIDDLVAAFGGRLQHAVVEAYSRADEAAAYRTAAGFTGVPRYRLDTAKLLVTFGSDPLAGGTTGLVEQVGFGGFRAAKGAIIAVEATLSQLGAIADHRVRCADDALAYVAWAVAERVAQALETDVPPEAKAALARAGGVIGELKPIDGVPAVQAIADRLLALRRANQPSLVYVGGANRAGDTALHLAAATLNALLRNVGTTVVAGPVSELADLGDASLVNAIAAGQVPTVIVAGTNPGHTHPLIAAALAKARTVVVLSDRLDETAKLATHVAPTLHALEDWGDAEITRGVYALQQPVIRPLWNARGAEQSLIAFAAAAGLASFKAETKSVKPLLTVVTRQEAWQPAAKGVMAWSDLVRQVWLTQVKSRIGSAADDVGFWNSALSVGVASAVADTAPMAALNQDAVDAALKHVFRPIQASGFRLVLSASRTLRDGASANNPWLNELPDPVSKVTWDNYLAVSPADAAKEGWSDDEVVSLSIGGTTVALPIVVQAGQHPGTLETFLGWGRTAAGQVARLMVDDGFSVDTIPLRAAALARESATVAKTGKRYQLANVQGHHDLEGRPEQFDQVAGAHDAEHGHHGWVAGADGKPPSELGGRLNLWGKTQAYPGRKWGMTVDLDLCTGCNACIVACSAENNVPVVGRDEVRRNREMHWMRIDRYYSGDAAAKLDVDVVQQPVMCQHCDNAPCEIVCPANATMHNDSGVNLMVYNRCIGTRYCSNNCPYKVRRFNWYEYSQLRAGPQTKNSNSLDRIQHNLLTDGTVNARAELAVAPLQMLLNPEVTVRSKGVMEKCNFCVQRTRAVKDGEKRSGRAATDGAITSACAQTCPSNAITFGDLNDPFSAVVQAAKAGEGEHRAFLLMDAELNTRPAVAYLRKLRHRGADPGTGTAQDAKHEEAKS